MKNHETPQAVEAVALAEVTYVDIKAAKAYLDISDNAGSLEFEARVRLDHTARAFARHRVSSVISAILEPGTRPIEVERDAEGRILICTGCGTVETVASIRERHATAFTCCPERKMAAAITTPPPSEIPSAVTSAHSGPDGVVEPRWQTEGDTSATPPPASNEHAELIALRAVLQEFDAYRLAVANRRPSAKRDEWLSELEIIRTIICRPGAADALQALSVASPREVELTVSNEDAIKFLETACRNWDYVRFSREDVVDVAGALSSFLRSRTTLDQG